MLREDGVVGKTGAEVPESPNGREVALDHAVTAEKPAGSELGSLVRQMFGEGRAVTSDSAAAALPAPRNQGLTLLRVPTDNTAPVGLPSPDGQVRPIEAVMAVGTLSRDYATAFNLLKRASDALPALMRQCQVLEAEILYTRVQAEVDTTAADAEKSRWQQLAIVLKNCLDKSDRDRTELRARLAVAEARADAERQLVDAAEHKARVAIGITTLFHDKIIESFGIGSQAHAALDAIVQDVLHDSDPAPGERGVRRD